MTRSALTNYKRQFLATVALLLLSCLVATLPGSFGSKLICFSDSHTAIETNHCESAVAPQKTNIQKISTRKCVDVALGEVDSLLNVRTQTFRLFFAGYFDVPLSAFLVFISRLNYYPTVAFAPREHPIESFRTVDSILSRATVVLRI